ncbi:hypothetical protein DENSPDRAFT_301052 [Dentipellis sp. KUC8613]|nr:hypothetical protein DENSPDRAFT_301052 [Dentipellis sp. KUC8613]
MFTLAGLSALAQCWTSNHYLRTALLPSAAFVIYCLAILVLSAYAPVAHECHQPLLLLDPLPESSRLSPLQAPPGPHIPHPNSPRSSARVTRSFVYISVRTQSHCTCREPWGHCDPRRRL